MYFQVRWFQSPVQTNQLAGWTRCGDVLLNAETSEEE